MIIHGDASKKLYMLTIAFGLLIAVLLYHNMINNKQIYNEPILLLSSMNNNICSVTINELANDSTIIISPTCPACNKLMNYISDGNIDMVFNKLVCVGDHASVKMFMDKHNYIKEWYIVQAGMEMIIKHVNTIPAYIYNNKRGNTVITTINSEEIKRN